MTDLFYILFSEQLEYFIAYIAVFLNTTKKLGLWTVCKQWNHDWCMSFRYKHCFHFAFFYVSVT